MFGFILILVLLSFGCSEHSSNPVQSVSITQPAGKSNEALGFDFRINHNGWLWDEEKIPYEYSMEIRRAAQRWESVIAWGHFAEHLVMPDGSFSLEFGQDTVEVWLPENYLDWSDIELWVFIDEEMEKEDGESFIIAYSNYYWFENSEEGTQVPIVGFGIPEYTLEDIRSGDITTDQWYSICIHELGHALGINKRVLSGKKLVGKSLSTASNFLYTGENGNLAFRVMTNKQGSIPMEDEGHFDAHHLKWRGYWDVMFQGYGYNHVKDKDISLASIGVLNDLGYVVYYDEANDTRVSWSKDPRNPNYVAAAKPIVINGQKPRCHVEYSQIKELEASNE